MSDSKNWFLPVDHRNLRAFYARGLVVPRILMPKYREDLLGLSSGVLPLFSDHPGTSVVRKSSGGGDGIPVVLEIRGDAVPEGASQPWGYGSVTAVATVIPTASIIAVHVGQEADAAEIRSREYRNIASDEIPLVLSPEVFSGDAGDIGILVEWLSTQAGLHDADAQALRDREAIAGGVLLLLDGIPAHDVILRKTAALLSALAHLKGPTLPAFVATLDELMWFQDADDAAIAACAISVIAAQSGPEPPTASEVLSDIRGFLNSVTLTDRAAADKYLDRIESISRGEDEFGPFRSHGGLRSLKALLLFLLRPEADRAKVWVQEETNSEDEVTALALVYAGLSLSAAGIPTGQRGTPLLQKKISAWCAMPFNDRMSTVGDLACEVLIEDGSTRLAKSGGATLRLWETEREPLRQRLMRSAHISGEDAVGFAKKLFWSDCLEWVVECDSLRVDRNGQRLIVRLQTSREPAVEVLSERFLDRLASMDDGEIDFHMAGLLSHPPKPAAKRKPAPRKAKVTRQHEEPMGLELPLE